MRLESRLRDLSTLTVANWPKHLKMARGMLVEELKLPEEKARAVVQFSLAAALGCAQRIDQRAQDVFQVGDRKRLRKIFARIARCAKRMPALRRHALDRKVRVTLHLGTIDSEAIETLIETLITAFGRWPKTEPSLTVLRSVIPRSLSAIFGTSTPRARRGFAEAAIFLQKDYSALRAIDQRSVESALTALLEKRKDKVDTADVCMTFSRALAPNQRDQTSPAAADLIIDYVAAVANIWSQYGLRPARARDPGNAAYHSRFHRFAELVLTSVVDPWSKRHDCNQMERLAGLRKAHAALPRDIGPSVRPTPRRSDVEWLISDDHLRKAIPRIQKTTGQTP
jgi:hypothetical protein